MFNDTIIVQTAISTFNNAALFSPMFFWTGLLMLPLFFIAYKYGNKFIDYTNIDLLKSAKNKTFNFSFVVLIAIFAWLAFVGGNYIVLRDETSVLPFVTAGLFFIMSASIIHKLRMINPDLPSWMQAIKYKKTFLWLSFIACAISVALLSGLDSGLGLLMMFAAVFCGGLLGRALKKAISPIFMTTFLMFVISVLILMQPEFFRFGQMGNLTIIHKIALVIISALTMAVFATRNIKPANKIYQSAYVKIKWLCRFLSLLSAALFIYTESVPVFLGMSLMFLISFALSVKHFEAISENVSKKLWACLLIAFGVLTVNPVISFSGCLYLSDIPYDSIKKRLKALL